MNKTIEAESFLALFPFFFLAAGPALSAAENPGEDWPRLLGPSANDISGEANFLAQWPSNGPTVVWDKPIGTGYGAPSVLGHGLWSAIDSRTRKWSNVCRLKPAKPSGI